MDRRAGGEQADIFITVATNFYLYFQNVSSVFPSGHLRGRQDRYSVPTSAVRHRSSPDYTPDAATVHGKTSTINYGGANRWRLHLQGRFTKYLMVKFNVMFKLTLKVNGIQKKRLECNWPWVNISLNIIIKKCGYLSAANLLKPSGNIAEATWSVFNVSKLNIMSF